MNKAEAFALMKSKGTNLIEDLTNAIVNNIKYADNTILYPPEVEFDKDCGIKVEWFYPAFKDPNGHSELDAINMYTTQMAMYEEAHELLLGISLIEMKHLDKLMDIVTSLGGTIDTQYNTKSINYGKNMIDGINQAIISEEKTITGYNIIVDKVSKLPKNASVDYTLKLLAKLIADETLHIKLLKEFKENNKQVVIKK